ncbi:hypothetical protein C5L59_25910, partial [Salmonella enterica]|nr:hypothetical protein [Salmonella enterica]EDA3539640.1 hypothetical protein [Salmonella enterica subsp. enterica serovar Typhimurium]EDU1225220.1 hypothetical protein [Salmonella enterica subsp. enterica serovar 4,[5],12:i:-]EEJ1697688.1 hypothetical protein [Salmonella enterica subsp. enterica]HAG8310087.1 hypothetical protein [Escherichia coli]
AELPRALDPDVAGAQGVLQLGQGADFVEFPVEAFRGDHQRLPARLARPARAVPQLFARRRV